MTDREKRMVARCMQHCSPIAPEVLSVLEVVAAELDDLESRIGSLKARPEDVREWTDGVGVPQSAAEMNEQFDKAYQRLYAGVVGRSGIAGELQGEPEVLSGAAKEKGPTT